MNLKKLDTKKEFYVLKQFSYSILHEAIRQKRWNIFVDTSIFILKDLLFSPDDTKMTPFHYIISLADHLTISHLIKEAFKGGVFKEEFLTQKNAKGQNILHLLIENKRIESRLIRDVAQR